MGLNGRKNVREVEEKKKRKKKQRKKNNAKIGRRHSFRGGFINNFRKIGVLYFGEYINTTRTLVEQYPIFLNWNRKNTVIMNLTQ